MMEEKFERVGKAIRVEFEGKKRLFMYSMRVASAVIQRDDTNTNDIDDTAFAAALMMEAGARYAKSYGLENPEPLTEDSLLDFCNLEDYEILTKIIKETVPAGKRQEIAYVDGDGNGEEKNGEAKPET